VAQVLTRIPLSKIKIRKDKAGRFNPASRTRDTTALQASIADVGLLDPIKVIQIKDTDTYWLNDGERRVTAVTALGWKDIPALVTTNDEDAFLQMIALNLHRPFSPLELADMVQRLSAPPNSYPKRRIATSMGMNTAKINLLISLLQASDTIQSSVEDGRLSLTAFAVIAKESSKRQEQVVEEVITKNPDEKMTTQSVRAAKQRIVTEEKGTRIAGDEVTVAQHINIACQHLHKVTVLCPLSPAEKLAVTYQLV